MSVLLVAIMGLVWWWFGVGLVVGLGYVFRGWARRCRDACVLVLIWF